MPTIWYRYHNRGTTDRAGAIPGGGCPECRWAEMSRAERRHETLARLADRALTAILPGAPASARIVQSVASSMAATISAGLGQPAEPDWYTRHRRAYEATGDQAELARMVRHVPVPR